MLQLVAIARRSATPSAALARRAFASAPTSHAVDNHAFLNGMTEAQGRKALQRGQEIRAQHHAAKDSFPSVSQGEREINADEANRKRVIYRSKQRGWLEVDLLLGSWASKNVMALSAEELQQYEDILNQETIDIFNYISSKDAIPAQLDTPIMKRLQEYSFGSPLGKASVEGFEANKKYMSN
ncbi:hypothetical protein PybrP1_012079 [[Pythium] brassicae (nom. inval.)]|nr:hypothetical protein PybrP1_012079 [[Pythium] brassicae (nom. inval.)]